MTQKHTPTPWMHGAPDQISATQWRIRVSQINGSYAPIEVFGRTSDECHANAAFIVRACNVHDDLIESGSALVQATFKYRNAHALFGAESTIAKKAWDQMCCAEEAYRTVLSNAHGEA